MPALKLQFMLDAFSFKPLKIHSPEPELLFKPEELPCFSNIPTQSNTPVSNSLEASPSPRVYSNFKIAKKPQNKPEIVHFFSKNAAPCPSRPSPALVAFIDDFLYGVIALDRARLAPEDVALFKNFIFQRIQIRGNRWLFQQVESLTAENCIEVALNIVDKIRLHRTHILALLIFSKVVDFGRRRELEPFVTLKMPRSSSLNAAFLKQFFSNAEWADKFGKLARSAEFKAHLIEQSRSSFLRAADKLLWAASAGSEFEGVKLSQKLNLGVSRVQAEKISEPFKKFFKF